MSEDMSLPAAFAAAVARLNGTAANNSTEIFTSPNYVDPTLQKMFIYGFAIARFGLGIVEIVPNTFLIWISVKYRSELHTPNSFLLGVAAFCEILIAISTFISLISAFAGFRWISSGTCLGLMSVPEISYNATIMLTFLIAADRAVSNFFAAFHSSLNSRLYLAVCLLLCLLFGAGMYFLLVTMNIQFGVTRLLKCSLTETWLPEYTKMITFCSYFFIGFAALCFLLNLWKTNNGKKIHWDAFLIARCAVLVVVGVGWAGYMFCRLFLHTKYDANALFLSYFLMNLNDSMILVSGSVGVAMLYLFSEQYRNIFKMELGRLLLKRGGRIEAAATKLEGRGEGNVDEKGDGDGTATTAMMTTTTTMTPTIPLGIAETNKNFA